MPLLGQIPLVSKLREGGDNGNPITVADPEHEASQAFRAIAERISDELKPKKVFRPELRIS